MFNLSRELCVGCEACSNICPADAITMEADGEGFLYPHRNELSCTKCGLCMEHCPVYKKTAAYFTNQKPIAVYAGWSQNPETRMSGSSGGIFGELAKLILEKGGYVAGAAFTEDHGAKHQLVYRTEDLQKLKKSKYVQSHIDTVFSDIKRLIEKQEQILFAGTPCQCMGLRAFLGGQPENLFLCDFICHGVNSPSVHRQYIREIEQNLGGKVEDIDHRNKNIGWEQYQFSIFCREQELMLGDKRTNPYIRGFLTNLYLRPSCYQCVFKGTVRPVDLTLGDCWGYPGNEPMGVSLILIHSQKGASLLKELRSEIYTEDYSLESAVQKNPSVASVSEDRHQKRSIFFSQLKQNGNFQSTIVELLGNAG